MSELKRTPLYELNKARGGRMVDFVGWEMPVQFESIVEEHKATRHAAGLFDVSHMGEATVKGNQATVFLDHALTNDIGGMETGRVVYSLMCYENGGVVDDLLVYKEGDNDYLLCLNASNTEKDIAWLRKVAGGYDVEIADVSSEYALVALQGPKAFDILSHLSGANLRELKYYWFSHETVGSAPCLVSRTGYTGEKGVELFVKPYYAEELVEDILREGEGLGLKLAGLGSRDSLRLEAGYSLYGHEISESISPVQANLMWTVKLNKESDFIGKKALLEEKAQGRSKCIVFFRTGSRRIVRPGAKVVCDDGGGGEVVSGTFSPILNEAIGSALIDARSAKADWAVDVRGKAIPLIPVKPPFIDLRPQG